MDKEQVHALMRNCGLPDSCRHSELRQTHISWIILTDHFAFKIKRPVTLPFLDFSTLEKRGHFCRRELELNRRLAPQMYLRVIGVTGRMVDPDGVDDEVIDYAVMMKKMDNRREMGDLLRQGRVSGAQVDRLADKIARFHRDARVIDALIDIAEFQENYAEILDHGDFIAGRVGQEWLTRTRTSVKRAEAFLRENQNYMNERVARGLRKDCHGDLSSHNIFLYDDPVIFDCIEFNESFRHIDILNEVAFLGTEFDFYDNARLGERFYLHYLGAMGLEDTGGDRRLLDFYKSYRANIRAKVNILHVAGGAVQSGQEDGVIADIRKYLELMFSCLHIT